MALYKGIQNKRFDYSSEMINEEILKINGFIPDEEAKVLLYKFLRNNIGYATEMLIGVKLFPFQEILIKSMMIADTSMYVLSRGMSKTWSAAIYVMLQLIFRQGVKIGVLSSGFRQAKMILQKAEDILKKPHSSIVSGLFKLQKGTDSWTLSCGRSSAIALPLADGSRLRGFRFQILLLDEFLNIPKNIFQEVILPFLGVVENPTEREDMKNLEDKLIAEGKMKEHDRYQWTDNKLILLSSPSHTFEYMFFLYCQYRDQILGVQDKSRDDLDEEDSSDLTEKSYKIIIQLSYECAPESLYDKKQLNSHRETMSEAVFQREYGGQFSDEGDNYFKLSKMQACTIPDGDAPYTEIKGNPDDEYVVAIDPSWSEDSGSDDFAIGVFKLDKDNQTSCLVHAYGLSGNPLKNHIQYFHYILTNFNVVSVILDNAGGVTFVSACNESDIFKEAGIKLGVIDTIENDFDKPESYKEDLLAFKKAHAPTQRKFCFLRKPTSSWIRHANELLQANIDHKRIFFAAPAQNSTFNNQRKSDIPIEILKWANKYKKPTSKDSAKIDFLDHQNAMIILTKQQAANIEVKSNPQGSQTFNLPQHMARATGPNKPKKDSYSVLVLGNFMCKVLLDSLNVEEEKPKVSTFTPFAAS